MWQNIKDFAADFFVTGDPLIYGADVAIVLTMSAIVFVLTYFKKWKWLWTEWLTTVDHKRIGIMYVIASLLMLFRGGMDALLMRTQLVMPEMEFLSPEHYNEIFTTHGVIMILFMAMPLMFGLFNLVVPLQIGARDVAFPFLNSLSFWLFFAGAMLFNISFVIGGSPNAGWLAYPPLSGTMFNPGVGQDFYIWGIQISGIGSLATGINFIVTILKMRAPGMKLMKMPMFSWSVLGSCLAIILAFPILTVTLALSFIDRYFGAHFFTLDGGGNPMMYINLIWMWGHPEVYIVVLPAFGIFSEIVATFARKKLFGYKSMVFAIMAISVVSFITWAHHFFTMGSGADVNAFFAVSTMIIAIPTGVKVFNWIFTMFKGKVSFETPMLWTVLGFIPCFVVGGMTGVMLSVAPADFQFHNSYFLIAHFHQTLIGGVVFGYIAGLVYWWPKVFGFKLNEKLGKWSFWFWNIGFYVCFMPQYVVGLMGMTRRVSTYSWDSGWWGLNLVSTIGGFLMGAGFLIMVWQILHSIKFMERDTTGDPWNGRTLEWSIPSPAPMYNFARTPVVEHLDDWWEKKERKAKGEPEKPLAPLEPIHMPKNSGIPIIMSGFWFLAGFGLVFDWLWMAIPGFLGVFACMFAHSFNYDTDYYIPVDEIERTEAAARGTV